LEVLPEFFVGGVAHGSGGIDSETGLSSQ
jgi:hypothetical protein